MALLKKWRDAAYSETANKGDLQRFWAKYFEEEKEIGGIRYQMGHSREYVKVAKKTKENLSNRILSGKIVDFLQEDILLMQ